MTIVSVRRPLTHHRPSELVWRSVDTSSPAIEREPLIRMAIKNASGSTMTGIDDNSGIDVLSRLVLGSDSSVSDSSVSDSADRLGPSRGPLGRSDYIDNQRVLRAHTLNSYAERVASRLQQMGQPECRGEQTS